LKPVAHAGFGEQMAGARRVVLQLAAQPRHVEAEVIGALLEPGTPDVGENLRRPDELAGTIQQELQDRLFGPRLDAAEYPGSQP